MSIYLPHHPTGRYRVVKPNSSIVMFQPPSFALLYSQLTCNSSPKFSDMLFPSPHPWWEPNPKQFTKQVNNISYLLEIVIKKKTRNTYPAERQALKKTFALVPFLWAQVYHTILQDLQPW